MGIVAALGAAASVASIASSASNLLGSHGGSSSPTQTQGGNPAQYIPTAQPQMDQYYQNLIAAQYPGALSLPQSVLPELTQNVNNLRNNPYAGQQLQGAQTIAGLSPGIAASQLGGAASLYNLGNQNASLVNPLIQSGFDPQTQLYNQMYQQTLDQANAANAMSGVAGPYAAGTINNATQNFNINWQNQQLQRELAAAQGVGGLTTSAGRGYSGAADLQGLGLQTLQTGTGLPYSTYQAQQGADLSALGQLIAGSSAVPGTGVYGNITSLYNPIDAYLGLGQSASGAALTGQAIGFNQNQQLGSQLASSLTNPSFASSLSQLFAPSANTVPQYNSMYGTTYDTSASDNYGYPGFDYSQAG